MNSCCRAVSRVIIQGSQAWCAAHQVSGQPPQWFNHVYDSEWCPQAMLSSCAAAAVTPPQLRQKSRVDIKGQDRHACTGICACNRHPDMLPSPPCRSQTDNVNKQTQCTQNATHQGGSVAEQGVRRRQTQSALVPPLTTAALVCLSSVSVCHRPSPQL